MLLFFILLGIVLFSLLTVALIVKAFEADMEASHVAHMARSQELHVAHMARLQERHDQRLARLGMPYDEYMVALDRELDGLTAGTYAQ